MPNTLITYTHVEDYIELIAGFRDVSGKSRYSIFQLPESPLNLARYDVKVLESFGTQSKDGIAFTDRQAKLATDLVIKYERQLAKLGVSVAPVKENPVFRIPLRQIDRTSRIWADNNNIYIRFPYNMETIDAVRTESKQSLGKIEWNPADKLWRADLTEYNLNWAYAFAQANKFEIDSTVTSLMNQILEVEKQSYAIELKAGAETLSITNAMPSLIEYIDTHLQGFAADNLLKLVDYAPILGYTCDRVIEEVVIEAYGPRFWSLCANKELKVDMTSNYKEQIAELVNYATATQRWPIYVYEPDMSDRLAMLFIRHFKNDEIVDLDKNPDGITANTRLVHTRKIPKTKINSIPLLVSSAGMLFGGDRQVWIQTADKVVYFSKEVYNKTNKKGKDVCLLN
jgi:hypothetical protein